MQFGVLLGLLFLVLSFDSFKAIVDQAYVVSEPFNHRCNHSLPSRLWYGVEITFFVGCDCSTRSVNSLTPQ